jgi:hypothetical protein
MWSIGIGVTPACITKTDHEKGEVVKIPLDIREYVNLLGQMITWYLNASLNVWDKTLASLY